MNTDPRIDLWRFLAQDQRVTFYRAQFGRRLTFLSQSDADAYDQGWHSFRTEDSPPKTASPFATGWWHAHQQFEDQFWELADEAMQEEE